MVDTLSGGPNRTTSDDPRRADARDVWLLATRRMRRVPPEVLVFVVALAARLEVLVRAGGLRGSNGYDASVYFAAADALTHGRLPYRDFVLLHPPGLPLALTPFALLTRLMSDESAFATAGVAFAVLGAVNAVLVARVAKHLGLGRAAALAGGLFYAAWFGAVGSEYLTKLEPLGNLLLLGAILTALRAERSGRRLPVLVGVLLGLALSVKIWWVVPVVGVIAWHAIRVRRARVVGRVLAGVGISLAVVDLPFFMLAPRQMWSAVVQDQLGRYRNPNGPLARLADLTSLPRLTGALPVLVLVAAGLIVAMLFVLAGVRAWRVGPTRPAVVLLVAQLAVVLAAPSWFAYYCDYLAVALALVVAGAASRSARRSPRMRTLSTFAPVVAVAVVTTLVLGLGTAVVPPFRGASRLTRAVESSKCVMSDTPLAQIELDTLSRGLAAGCPNWVDVTGLTYGPYRPSSPSQPRADNPRWQRAFVDYLRSGDAVIVLRHASLNARSRSSIARDGVLARAGGHTVYRVRRRSSGS